MKKTWLCHHGFNGLFPIIKGTRVLERVSGHKETRQEMGKGISTKVNKERFYFVYVRCDTLINDGDVSNNRYIHTRCIITINQASYLH